MPVEQAALAETVAARDLTAIYSRYNVAGALAGAIGALASALPAIIASGQQVRAFRQRCRFLTCGWSCRSGSILEQT